MSQGRWMVAASAIFLLASVAVQSGVGSAPGASATPSLQALIDATATGSRLSLSPGVYSGPARIDRPMQVDGGGLATLQGTGHGTVLAVSGRGVHVSGLVIRGSGESHDSVDAGVLVEGDHHEIRNNVIEDVLFGVHLRGANHNRIVNNQVKGKPLALGMRGDVIRLWHGRFNQISDNRFQRGRDLTVANSPDNVISGNRFVDGRYGMHIVFSPRLRVEDNHLSDTGTGIVVLYSPDLVLRGNHVEHAMSGGGAGMVFKESDAALVEDNVVLHCSVGLKVDAPPEPVGVLTVRNNRFAHNITGLFFYGEAGGHVFENNRFENNLTSVALSAVGVAQANRWSENYWDDYLGFDRNRDGFGDTPHEIWLYADRLWMENPMASFFRNSPSLELLDFLERLAPFSLPYRVLKDESPRVSQKGP